MYQPNSGHESRMVAGEVVDTSTSHRVDMLSLAILSVGFFSCLIRSDYNFPLLFFCYFVWQQRKDSLALKIILATCIVLLIFDTIFAFTEIRVWLSEDEGNSVWQTIRPMHNFGVFCFALITVLKIVLIVFVALGLRNLAKAVQPI